MTLTSDAILLGLYLRGPRASLSFGGKGYEQYDLTKRAEDAVACLQENGYAVVTVDETGRTTIRGTDKKPTLVSIAQDARVDPFAVEAQWALFDNIGERK